MFSTVVLLQVRLPSSNSWSKIRVDSPGQLDGVIVDLPLLHTQVVVGQLLQGGHLWGTCFASATDQRQGRTEKETTTCSWSSQQSLRLRTAGPLPVARVQITCCQPSSPSLTWSFLLCQNFLISDLWFLPHQVTAPQLRGSLSRGVQCPPVKMQGVHILCSFYKIHNIIVEKVMLSHCEYCPQ